MLAQTGREAERQLRIPGIGSVTSSAALVQPELIIRPTTPGRPNWALRRRPLRARCAWPPQGITTSCCPNSTCPERQVPIRVKLPESTVDSIDNIRQLLVPGRGSDSQCDRCRTVCQTWRWPKHGHASTWLQPNIKSLGQNRPGAPWAIGSRVCRSLALAVTRRDRSDQANLPVRTSWPGQRRRSGLSACLRLEAL